MATGQVLFFKAGSCFAPSASLLKIENCARFNTFNTTIIQIIEEKVFRGVPEDEMIMTNFNIMLL